MLTLPAMVLAVSVDGGGVLSIATVVATLLVVATSVVGGGVPSGVSIGG